ncbi:MAG: DUF3791 domain-containing protein [Treponema sp.]|nr:DUF3791 domain-containing protein [Treponema sp.]
MTSAPVHFLIFCIETYKIMHHMSGEEVFGLFDRHGITGFIIKFHDVLHIESPQSIVAQIDEFIEHGTHKAHCLP